MSRLDDYRMALLAVHPDVSSSELNKALDTGTNGLVEFVKDHGLGPVWHARTAREEFHEVRLAAEALFIAQSQAINDIDAAMQRAGIAYVVIKGAATRGALYENPAMRACHDIDLLVAPKDRLRAAELLIDAGFKPSPDEDNISRELVLTRGSVDIDLHWALLREGRLREAVAADFLARRKQSDSMSLLDPNDTLFVLLVHPAFAKHLAGWGMGMHRVADILLFLRTQTFDAASVCEQLGRHGVRAGAWATLEWTSMLTTPYEPDELLTLRAMLRPGPLRRAWVRRWLQNDLSQRVSGSSILRWLRLISFSALLHDTPRDVFRALLGRRRAFKRRAEDMDVFADLKGE